MAPGRYRSFHWSPWSGPRGGGSGQARVDDDKVGLLKLLALEQMLQRYRMRLGRITAHDDLGLRIPDIVEAVGHRAVAPGVGYARDCR